MIKTKITLNASPAILFGVLAIAGGTVPAYAGSPAPPVQKSRVTDTVTGNGARFDYDYTVFNDGSPGFIGNGGDGGGFNILEPIIRDWELPYFNDSGITGIISPLGWRVAIETIGVVNNATGWGGVAAWQNPSDPFYGGAASPFTNVTQVIHWYTTDSEIFGIPTAFSFEGQERNNFLGGFGFTADFDSTGAPYQASWALLPIQTGDPAFPLGRGIPGSPNALGNPQVPEPELLALIAVGLAGWSMTKKKKKKAG